VLHTALGPISPELVLVDPALRAAVLGRMQEEFKSAPSRGASPVYLWTAAPAMGALGGAVLDPVAAGSGGDDESHAVIRALHWWVTVLLHSMIVVAVVLGTVYLARATL
jgi:hypothetical protein